MESALTLVHPSLQGPRWGSVLEDSGQNSTILVIDNSDINRHLVKATLKADDYRILEARRPSQALAILESEAVDLVIVDMVLPEMTGPEFCRALRADRRTQLIPILMTTSIQGADNEVTGLESGADDFLIKPIKPTLARVRVRTMLRHKALVDSLEEAEAILFTLAQAVEHRDKYTGLHCERLATYSIVLAQALGLSRQDQLALFRGGYLHDIGKISIPDAVLFKPGKLNAEEWAIMHHHTIRGEEMCRPMKSLAPVLPIIRNHHERWDGTGYPDKLSGDEIPLLARVLQVADIYDALTTSRPYKPAYPHQQAVEVMLEETRRGWRDPELVPLFARISEHWTTEDPASWHDSVSMQQAIEAMRRELSA
jgi:putative two-component system response regulator